MGLLRNSFEVGKFTLVNRLKSVNPGSEELRTRQIGDSAWHRGACINAVFWKNFLVLIYWVVLQSHLAVDRSEKWDAGR